MESLAMKNTNTKPGKTKLREGKAEKNYEQFGINPGDLVCWKETRKPKKGEVVIFTLNGTVTLERFSGQTHLGVVVGVVKSVLKTFDVADDILDAEFLSFE